MSRKAKALKKELKLFDVYAIAMGTTLSSGFFLMPGLAFAESGPAIVFSYLIAALLVVPAMFSMVELATAMPKAGGAYYFLDRSMGPLVGTVGGLGTWLVLILKSAFALIGMGAYVGLFFPNLPIVPIAAVLAVLFGLINMIGAKKTGVFQIVLVFGLLVILLWFMGIGIFDVRASHFRHLFAAGFDTIFATSGLVYISYAGLTKITSVAEEVENPERNLPLGMFLALVSAIVVYAAGTYVMVGVVPPEVLSGDLTPAASAAEILVGRWGVWLITAAAVLAFFAAANAGILSASRYPLAMSRDQLLPSFFDRVGASGAPGRSVTVTVGLILVCIVAFDPTKIAKLASAFQLLMFALLCMAVVVMRESRIDSYDPGYRSPFYPWMQIVGVLAPFFIIAEMGDWSILFSLGLLFVCIGWYFYYAKKRVRREGAMYHVFARLGQFRYEGLDRELRGILKEKGLREEDPFDEIVMRAFVIDHEGEDTFEDVVAAVASYLARRLPLRAADIEEQFLQGTRVGATPVANRVALPHIRVEGLDQSELVMVRSRTGVAVEAGFVPLDHQNDDESPRRHEVDAFFFLASPEEHPGQHLRILAQLAGRVDEESFSDEWQAARDETELKEVLLRDERFLSLYVGDEPPASELAGLAVSEIAWPEQCLVAMIRREGQAIVPRGSTVVQRGDRLTIIGEPASIVTLIKRYHHARL